MIMTIAEEEVGETNRQDKIGAGEVDRIRDQGKREREGFFFFFQCLLIFECSASGVMVFFSSC